MSVASKNPAMTSKPSTLREKKGDDEFMAAAIGDVEWLKQSITAKDKTNFDKNGLAALHLASLHGRLACVKLLVEKYKQDVNLKSSTGWSPVHLAISSQTGKRSFLVLEYLLKKGADFSVANDDGITPMHQAASEGHIQCLKALIERGAKIYVKDYRGHTPLDLAKLWGHRQCARILATEQWHQEKDEVAKDLAKLKKSEMIKELNGLTILDDEYYSKEQYGSDAYKNWLTTKGLQVNEGKVKGGTKSNAKKSDEASGLYKPNTIADARILGKVSTHTAGSKQGQQTPKTLPDNNDFYIIHKKKEPTEEKLLSKRQTRRKNPALKDISVRWNYSPQCKLLDDYQNDLKDCYPRVPATRLPHRDAVPKYLATHKNVPISAFSKPDAYQTERQVIFQPETILDAQAKTKYSENTVMNKPQVFLHLTSDLESLMFHRGLYIDPFKNSSSNSRTSTIEKTSTRLQSPQENAQLTPVEISRPPNTIDYVGVGGILPL